MLQSPDRSPQELKTIEDWVLERRYRSIQGVADDSGFGGTTMQYQVLLDPNKLFAYGVTVPQVMQQLGNNNANAGGGFYSQGGQFYYIRGLGLVRDDRRHRQHRRGGARRHSGLRAATSARWRSATRRGWASSGTCKQDDAVEGVILMRVGRAGAGDSADASRAMTKELNEHVLPPDVKVVPYYDRQDLIAGDDPNGRAQPAARHAAGAGRFWACSCSACARR